MGDFSQRYTDDNRGMIFFALGNNKTSFKPFVDSFSFSFANAVDKAIGNIFNKTISIEEFKEAKYTVSFNVLATNVNESIENHKKFQKLLRMIMPQDADNLAVAKVIYVKFSNLISSKGQTGKNNMSARQIVNQGFEGIIKSLKYEPDMEMGFFEYNGMLFSKAFKINFDLTAIPKDNKSVVPTFRSGYNYGRVYTESNLPVFEFVGPEQPQTQQENENNNQPTNQNSTPQTQETTPSSTLDNILNQRTPE